MKRVIKIKTGEGSEQLIETNALDSEVREAIYYANRVCDLVDCFGGFYEDLAEYLKLKGRTYKNLEVESFDGDDRLKPPFEVDEALINKLLEGVE